MLRKFRVITKTKILQHPYSYTICRLLLTLLFHLLKDSSMRRGNATVLRYEDEQGTLLFHSVNYNSVEPPLLPVVLNGEYISTYCNFTIKSFYYMKATFITLLINVFFFLSLLLTNPLTTMLAGRTWVPWSAVWSTTVGWPPLLWAITWGCRAGRGASPPGNHSGSSVRSSSSSNLKAFYHKESTSFYTKLIPVGPWLTCLIIFEYDFDSAVINV